jgi:hypothetical protein
MNNLTITIPFFFRRINDLNQYLPIIDHLLKEKKNILLICLNQNFNLKLDPRLKKYIDKPNVKIKKLEEFLLEKRKILFTIYLILNKFKLLNKLNLKFREFITTKKNFLATLNNYNIFSAIFDYPVTNQNIINIILILKKTNIKIFGIHHAIWVRDINLKNKKIKKIFNRHKEKSKNYDIILVFNKEYKEALKKIKCNAKFIFYGLLKKKKIKEKKIIQKKITTILYLDHSYKHGIKKKIVVENLKKLTQVENVKIIIRPNTSIEYQNNKDDLKIFHENNLGDNISYDLTINLIKKSDLIINPISSVVIEAFLEKKIIIHPSHFIPDERMLWQRFGCCFDVKNYDELKNIVIAYKQNNLKVKKYYKNCSKMMNFLLVNNNLKLKIKRIISNIS